ncbi:MAG: hypothetical protein A2887_01505 [Alphaproteobacteria bacterium RIFCSPLOWO2_01_FULL_40_26]|nr:MAG: hypothetical protein A3D15_04155 [Alphaproteobacteria bacterium RIFCSPHIGHO2_02_FULL_40_34]OFW88313.1 MAG: hypothetical protein A2794_04855 [Alphaproteobacteria bacterium RIFCSPHIGHO2_01_FULL_40_8]OFW94960.1 MAG: hypothetical protein A2887_01505 [Alphaproteobacteria bacterium RIFCSPLOWO2_01_FULL_40_26]OFX09893.1 MAG: hypothetical protein A3H30_06085 [Alphaproteobacteria bacterium RIFCSPLOWO2_02_FULL_40_19]OFX10786.1 MAG: hypothetical protein A3G22_01685 [Alphaproteobacteria bacterium RI
MNQLFFDFLFYVQIHVNCLLKNLTYSQSEKFIKIFNIFSSKFFLLKTQLNRKFLLLISFINPLYYSIADVNKIVEKL